MSKKMEYREGATRRVLLVGNFAVKFARTGIIYFFRNICRGVRNHTWLQEKIVERDKGSTLKTLLLHVLVIIAQGVKANQQEYSLYMQHPELPLAPVHHLLFGGLVLVMERGEAVNERTSQRLRRKYSDNGVKSGGDLDKGWHVFKVRGRLVFIDYGHPDAPRALGVI